MVTLSAMGTTLGLDLGIPQEIKDTALAYLEQSCWSRPTRIG
ncbi:MAG: hypothetical protein R2704_13955 [Microthrixaceae bacterium]